MTRQNAVCDANAPIVPTSQRGEAVPAVEDLAQALGQLRHSDPGCLLAAYGDLGARLVLRADPPGGWPQEALDELCAQASAAYALAHKLGLPAPTEPIVAMVPGETRVFATLAEDDGAGEDVVLLVCDGGRAAERLLPKAQDLLHQMNTHAGAGDVPTAPPLSRMKSGK